MTSGRSDHEMDRPYWLRAEGSRQLVVIAASAGGLKPLCDILAGLPQDFPAAIAVVQHRGEQFPDLLSELIRWRTALEVRDARDGDLLEPGTVYVCPPGVHMTVERSLRLVAAPRLAHVRPNADLMLRSAAEAYGRQAIGVVLSGLGRDATAGCRAVREAGGTVVAQDPASSAFPDMPAATVGAGHVDFVLTAEEIAAAITGVLADRREAAGALPVTLAPDPIRVTSVLL